MKISFSSDDKKSDFFGSLIPIKDTTICGFLYDLHTPNGLESKMKEFDELVIDCSLFVQLLIYSLLKNNTRKIYRFVLAPDMEDLNSYESFNKATYMRPKNKIISDKISLTSCNSKGQFLMEDTQMGSAMWIGMTENGVVTMTLQAWSNELCKNIFAWILEKKDKIMPFPKIKVDPDSMFTCDSEDILTARDLYSNFSSDEFKKWTIGEEICFYAKVNFNVN